MERVPLFLVGSEQKEAVLEARAGGVAPVVPKLMVKLAQHVPAVVHAVLSVQAVLAAPVAVAAKLHVKV